jgi:hypothetical protein
MALLPFGGLFQGSAWCNGSISAAMVGGFDMEDREIRMALDCHWAASGANEPRRSRAQWVGQMS